MVAIFKSSLQNLSPDKSFSSFWAETSDKSLNFKPKTFREYRPRYLHNLRIKQLFILFIGGIRNKGPFT